MKLIQVVSLPAPHYCLTSRSASLSTYRQFSVLQHEFEDYANWMTSEQPNFVKKDALWSERGICTRYACENS